MLVAFGGGEPVILIVRRHVSVQLRPAEPGDHENVANVLIESRAAFMPYAPSAHPRADVRAWVQRVLVPSGDVTVATVGGGVAGVLAVSNRDGYGWIEQLYVSPSLVNQGIGSTLLNHALSVLSPPIRLYTFQANTGARRFYERNGFHAVQFTDGGENEERCPDVLLERQSVFTRGA